VREPLRPAMLLFLYHGFCGWDPTLHTQGPSVGLVAADGRVGQVAQGCPEHENVFGRALQDPKAANGCLAVENPGPDSGLRM